MTETAYASIRGAEISERSTELVLPSSPPSAATAGTHDLPDASERPTAGGWRATPLAEASPGLASLPASADARAAAPLASPRLPPHGSPLSPAAGTAASAAPPSDPTIITRGGGTVSPSATESPIPASPSERPASLASERPVSRPVEAVASVPPTAASIDSDTSPASPSSAAPAAEPVGRPLPGDRGPREQAAGSPRPSFWRRIALGRRAQALRSAQAEHASFGEPTAASEPQTSGGSAAHRNALDRIDRDAGHPGRFDELVPRGGRALEARGSEAIERRIVEPLLQALVSVEAKLERSHVDLIGRSDQVEQRLTQLWDIEEQLGALGDLQETVLQVTEQQRRLEAALVAQTRILRWLVGGIILSLAVAAFSVAFFLRVAG